MDIANSNFPSVIIDVNEKPNDAISYKPSVKSYATRVFQESTIGIVSSIFTTHSKCRRFFKVFLSSLCIAGFMYHCIALLSYVLKYPEVMDISLDRTSIYYWPAYTYCNNNAIRRSVFCDTYPQHCVKPSEEFCKKYASYCGANATLIPKEEHYHSRPSSLQAESIMELGNFSSNSILLNNSEIKPHAKKADEISGPYIRCSSIFSSFKPCYSIHSRVESKRRPLLKKKKGDMQIFHLPDEWIRFYINESEMMNPRSINGIYFSVHSPFDAVNPLQKGFFLKAGRTYKLYVEMEREVLLKEPFESNCIEYYELWKKNNRTGPQTKKMCLEKCYLDFVQLQRACIYPTVLYPHKDLICGEKILSNDTNSRPATKDDWTFLHKCQENCRDECRSSKYTSELFIQDEVEFVKEEERHGTILVEIYLKNDEIKVLKHSPKYETVDVISSVGGFMGCWLGIALMDILDVFGSIMTVCSYGFRKRL